MNGPSVIHVVRHAEAEKTIRAIHGGAGMPLTTLGRVDAAKLGDWLCGVCGPAADIVAAPRPQALETASIIAERMDAAWRADADLRNIHMGLFDGLTDDEALAADQAAYDRLAAWRRGELEVEAIRIPGQEPFPEFLARVDRALGRVLASRRPAILTVTRSVGIAAINLLSNPGCREDSASYRRVRLDPGSATSLESKQGNWRMARLNDTSFLGRRTSFADD